MRISEVGGMYAYLIKGKGHSPVVIEDFFRMLFFNENVSNRTIYLLRERFIESITGTRKMSSTYRQMLVIKTWNAYITNKEYKTLRWDEAREGKLWFI